MATNLGELKEQIRQDLNEYQAQLSERLEQLFERSLISRTQLEEITREAKVTGQAVFNALQSPASQVEDVTEIYVYSLFDNYKESVEQRIAALEKKLGLEKTGLFPDLIRWLKRSLTKSKNSQQTADKHWN
ncbi:MAG: hypothetical protein KME26_18720 [Oscillatoria princeps RMCB-10]|jgi:uncharacterized protein YfkK (UPF0435 family)|nr:hypothetical protein [Oscillatoria princeps RMCB-10]